MSVIHTKQNKRKDFNSFPYIKNVFLRTVCMASRFFAPFFKKLSSIFGKTRLSGFVGSRGGAIIRCPLIPSHRNLVGERLPCEDRRYTTAAGTPQNGAHPTTSPVENPISTIARMCMGGQAQSVSARLVCQKARRAAAVNGAKRSS